MKRYEVAIEIKSQQHKDRLIVALVHQGCEVYYNPESDMDGKPYVCFNATEETVHDVTKHYKERKDT